MITAVQEWPNHTLHLNGADMLKSRGAEGAGGGPGR
jgi:hypothetical protein